MGLASRFMLMIIVPITILIGFSVTFSFIGGKLNPFDLFDKIKTLTGNYLLIGVFILLGIVFFGFFLFLKEKFLGSS
jgi:uncharacterized BrkB/YihY/UPF0761 family membrane protein